MLLKRNQRIENFLKKGKVFIIYGPRQVGKTTLVKQFLDTTKLKYLYSSGDNIRIQHILSSRDFPKILEYVHGYELFVLDEAQQIPEVGMGLKIIVDQRPDISVIATGSSSFDLANSVGEPLTGRKRTMILYPIAQLELLDLYNRFEMKQRVSEFLLYGSYPEVITAETHAAKQSVLEELVGSYLLKDILAWEKVKGSKILLDLLKLLAFQIGQEVSYHELATQLGIDTKTVQRYLDLCEKTFILFRLSPFSRNMRNAISKKQKYYFFDTGIRNAVIAQWNALEDRADVGALWENFIVIERLKKRNDAHLSGYTYFWRSYAQNEIDLIEEHSGALHAFEIKWSEKKSVRPPREWTRAFPDSTFEVITPENYLDFIT